MTLIPFTEYCSSLQVIKDYQLFMVVGVLLTIDLAIMTTWQVFDPFYRFTKTMEPRVSKCLLWTLAKLCTKIAVVDGWKTVFKCFCCPLVIKQTKYSSIAGERVALPKRGP